MYENIDTLLATIGNDECRLPAGNDLPPSGQPMSTALDDVLSAPASPEGVLLDFLKPTIGNKLILHPVHYQSLLETAGRTIAGRAKQIGSTALEAAAKLLAEEQALHDHLATQRCLLLRT